MADSRKLLTRIRLINWHYFENECIALHGSTLISGENTSGKSTILDAIQLVLTTNTRRFNLAANERGKRELKGYIRCKVGKVGETYLRKGTVPANVALEFYEERDDRYFVMGVHMLSQDEESLTVCRWYVEECRLEDLSFITDGRPSLADEFRVKGRKLRFIDQKKAAKDRFKRRMGNLDEKFFDLIPKSLAFKPMDRVKEFINRFVLAEASVDVSALRENIEMLNELEELLQKSQNQLTALEEILACHEKISKKEHEITVNELMIAIAAKDALAESVRELERTVSLEKQTLTHNTEQLERIREQTGAIEEQILAIQVSIRENAAHQLVEELNRRVAQLEGERSVCLQEKEKLQEQTGFLRVLLKSLVPLEKAFFNNDELYALTAADTEADKTVLVERLKNWMREDFRELDGTWHRLQMEMDRLNQEIGTLQERLKKLEKRRLTWPEQTVSLKTAIEQEFAARGIDAKVSVLADLLEIADERWRNAVEGYLHTQKFYLIVEPEYYDIAIAVYQKKRTKIHSAGIINTKQIPIGKRGAAISQEKTANESKRTVPADSQEKTANESKRTVPIDSLADVIRSENRYALAYATWILGRVARCDTVEELEKYPIAITPECMLYQGYVLRHINPRHYRDPYIGQNAYRVQITHVREEIEEKSVERGAVRMEQKNYAAVLEAARAVNPELMEMYLHAPEKEQSLNENIRRTKEELAQATDDPTLIELKISLEGKNTERASLQAEEKRLMGEEARLQNLIQGQEEQIRTDKEHLTEEERRLEGRADTDIASWQEAMEKYRDNKKRKSSAEIRDNFAPRGQQYRNEREALLNGKNGLLQMQYQFNSTFAQDYMTGTEGIGEYRDAARKLKAVEMVRYEERLRGAKEDCEEIFRSDFLSKMKEHIEAARSEFNSLNRALENIYYGEDSYHFRIGYDRKKEGLYKMITSEKNQEGYNLWSASFEAEYRDQMNELFDKLTTRDDNGEQIVQEYTDYRSYLDYDIEIRKKDGSIQRFSDIYGEKSGSETQVPYYVTIAASFYQLYRYGNSVRLMLLDEAFDKMDDERIGPMMDFLSGLGLQVILATPPQKIETIGEKVDTILTTIRIGERSIVDEYEL